MPAVLPMRESFPLVRDLVNRGDEKMKETSGFYRNDINRLDWTCPYCRQPLLAIVDPNLKEHKCLCPSCREHYNVIELTQEVSK